MDNGGTAKPVEASALTSSTFLGLQRLTAVDTVRARIGLAVDLGLMKPSERLPDTTEIAQALDVSEITVRRALERLCADGVLLRLRGRSGGTLVAPEPRTGTVAEVAAYHSATEHVHRLIDQRVIVDCGLAALAAAKPTKRALQQMRRSIRDMDRAESWAQFHHSDEAFHRAVARASRLRGAEEAYLPVLHELYRFYLPYPIDYLRSSNDEHRQLVDALERGDTDGAVAVARNHVETLHRTMFMGLSGQPNH